MSSVDYRAPEVLAFVIIPIVLAALFVVGVAIAWRRTGAAPRALRAATIALVATTAWMGITWQVAATGVFRQWDAMPPPLAILVVLLIAIALRLGFGAVGGRFARGLPLWVLVGVQGFRLPLELAMHRMAERGIMPPQMSYSGLNYDILTGTGAIVVALLLATGRGGSRLVQLWNVIGLLLLVNIVVIAILSTPLFRYFGDDRLNVWVTYPPFVWLPAVMVLAALAGHLVVFRALRVRARP